MNLLVLVVDDEPDVELLFRQQFRHDLRAGRFTMEFAQSGDVALQRIADAADVSIILILSDINMPGMTGLELLPKAKAVRPDVPVILQSRSILKCCARRSTRGLNVPRDYVATDGRGFVLKCHRHRFLKRPGASSVYRTVLWIERWPR